MKGILAFLAILGVAYGYGPGLRVKFNLGFGFGSSYFFNVPTTVSEIIADGWTRKDRPDDGYLPQLNMYCPPDLTLCAFFDDTGYIAGVQVGLRVDELSELTFDLSEQGFTAWETTTDDETRETVSLMTLQKFFVDAEYLQRSAEERINSRSGNTILQAGGVWLVGPDGLLRVDDDEDETRQNSVFTEQACIPWMGRHFYYNMSTSTECTAKQMYPWFPLYNNKELVAHGFIIFGQLTPNDSSRRDWFERPPRLAVQTIVPRGPDCLYDLSSSPGVLTMHIYYVDDPREFGFCLW